MGVWYASREDVKSALDFKESARNNAQIDRALDSSTGIVEGLLHRKFYPLLATRYFEWPGYNARPWRLWLNQHELISATSVSSGGVTVASSDYFLEPVNSGPPYNRVEIDLASNAAFVSAATHQRNIAIAGVWMGCPLVEDPAGNLAEALDASETAVDVTNSGAIGVGHIIRVDNERMTVTEKTMLTTGQTLQVNLAATANAVTVAVTDGTAFALGEVILLDSERMLIVDVAGNNLTVKRSWDGTVLATHAGSTVYAPRRLTVVRGALGTTAAIHTDASPIVKHVPPGLVKELATAEALNVVMQEVSGYARTSAIVGENAREKARELSGRGIVDLRNRAVAGYGRKSRLRAI